MKMTQSRKKAGAFSWQYISLVFALLAIVMTHLCAPPAGLTSAGFQVLGVLVAAIILFLSCGIGWTSMFIVFSLMLIPGLKVSQVTQATFGNSTAVFLVFCFMMSACLTKTGAAKRIAVWFLTNKFARKGAWWTFAMFLAAAYLLDLVLSASVCIMILLPIVSEMLDSVGVDKNAKTPLASAMLLGAVVAAQLANGANPISHAVTLQGFSLYESYTGEPMNLFIYCIVCTPTTAIMCALFFLLVRYVWKPDMSPLSGLDYEGLQMSCSPMGKREKIAVAMYIACVIFWLLPGLSASLIPSLSPVLGKISNCFPPLVALFLMNFIHVDGKPILAWEDAVSAVSWPTYMFIATIMGLGSFISNKEIGLSLWMSTVLTPVFENVNVWVFLIIIVLLINVLTNFCSNSVAQAVGFAIAIPLCMGIYDGQISVLAASILLTNAALNGWATSPATPTAAIAYAPGWGNEKTIFGWGMLAVLINTIVSVGIALPLANLLCR